MPDFKKKDRPFHTVSITSPGVSGHGTKVHIDGGYVKGLRGVDLHIGMDEPSILRLEMIVDGVNVEAEAFVEDDDGDDTTRSPKQRAQVEPEDRDG